MFNRLLVNKLSIKRNINNIISYVVRVLYVGSLGSTLRSSNGHPRVKCRIRSKHTVLQISKSANPWEKIWTKPTTHVPKIREYPLQTRSITIPRSKYPEKRKTNEVIRQPTEAKKHTHIQPWKPRALHAHHHPGDLGPGPSLDLSLYPLLQAPWAYKYFPDWT
jgi:hypothetical protein